MDSKKGKYRLEVYHNKLRILTHSGGTLSQINTIISNIDDNAKKVNGVALLTLQSKVTGSTYTACVVKENDK